QICLPFPTRRSSDLAEDGKWMVVQDERPEDIPYGQWRHTIAAAGSAPYFFQAELAGPDGQEFTTERDIMKVAAVETYLPYLKKRDRKCTRLNYSHVS